MAGQDLTGALIKVVTAQSQVYQYQAVIEGTLEDTITLGAVNGSAFAGFVLQDASSGQTVQVHRAGGIAKAIAGASVSKGAYLIIESTDGRLKNATMTNTNMYVVAKCLRDGVDGDVVPVMIMEFVGNLP